jgi:arylsulfatase A-like enzyme
MRINRLLVAALAATLLLAHTARAQSRPNIVFIYADDLGYGDVSSYGATALKTPNIDRLAREGLRFTDAHAAASTCTPSRYALLTGEYAWRKRGTGILPGDAALIIAPGRTTLPAVLQRAGFVTGAVGKWHLGLGPQGGPDWNHGISPSPNEVGFDYSFVMAATGDRVPSVYIEDHAVVGLDPADPISVSYTTPVGDWPTGKTNPDQLKMHPSHGHDQTIVNGVSRIGYMTGGVSALWKDEEMASVFTGRAVKFIESQKAKPFFLYFALHDPHVPRLPNQRFVGTTSMGPRGDAIVEGDWCVGQILDTLDRLHLADSTLVVFTSDNGPVVDDGYKDGAVEHLGAHKPAGPFRGGKYSIFEGGTRVPFIVRWPGHVKAGLSDALVSQVDLLASFAALTGQSLAAGDAPDSVNTLPAFLGRSKAGRVDLVEQSAGIALRQGPWKYVAPHGGPRMNVETNTELGNDTAAQLYDLAHDPGERQNLAGKYPERVKAMEAVLEKTRQGARPRKS